MYTVIYTVGNNFYFHMKRDDSVDSELCCHLGPVTVAAAA